MASGSGSELFEALLIEPMQPEASRRVVFLHVNTFKIFMIFQLS